MDALTTHLYTLFLNYGLIVLFLGVVFTGDVAIFVAFMLVWQGLFSVGSVFTTAVLGILSADIFWFTVGTGLSSAWARRQRLHNKHHRRIQKAKQLWTRLTKDNMVHAMLLVRFVYGLRLPTILYLSTQRVSFKSFVLYDAAGIIMYVPILGLLGMLVGKGVDDAFSRFNSFTVILLVFVILLFLAIGSRYVLFPVRPRRRAKVSL